MDRYVSARIRADVAQKLVFLTGPRQVGKTVLAQADPTLHRALDRFANENADALAVQIVRHLRQPERPGRVDVLPAADWLAGLSA